jgi:serpin B
MVIFTMAAFIETTSAQPSASDTNTFPFKLYQQVAREKPKGNVLISPFSVSTALSMTYSGSAGATKKALAKVLDFSNDGDDAVHNEAKKVLDSLSKPGGNTRLEIANGLFGDKKIQFKPPFLASCKQFFNANLRSLDFSKPETVTEINSWVSSNTHGKIPTIIDQIGANAVLYLINAIYFKGSWEHKFEKQNTEPASFTTASGASKNVQMMHQHRNDFQYLENNEFQAINLRYADKRLSLYVFLPKEGKTLEAFDAKFNQQNWNQWTGEFNKRTGHLGLPRFKIDDKFELRKPLTDLGLGVAFDQGKAEFPDMANTNLFITKVIHKTFMEVNEEGTEAAAVTAIEMAPTGMAMNPPKPFKMIVDRPFFVALHDKQTGKILFAGHITHP